MTPYCHGRGTSCQIGDRGPTQCHEGGGARHARGDGVAVEYEYKERDILFINIMLYLGPLMHNIL